MMPPAGTGAEGAGTGAEAVALATSFLERSVAGKRLGYASAHPWRAKGEFILLHSLRVEHYARRIAAAEGRAADPEESAALRVAAILHDIGRIGGREDHARRGRDLVAAWFGAELSTRIIPLPETVLELVSLHSAKEEAPSSPLLDILIDADILDEIGVMSIFMASNRISREDPYFFEALLDRVEEQEIPFCERGFGLLRTGSGRGLLRRRLGFLELARDELREELAGTEGLRKTAAAGEALPR